MSAVFNFIPLWGWIVIAVSVVSYAAFAFADLVAKKNRKVDNDEQ